MMGNVFSPGGRRARLAVFCYHQVLEAADLFRAGEPTAAEFARDVELIDAVFSVLPFGEAVARLATNTLPKRAACITFDDGYENNHSLAAPILEKAGVPATFFVTGGAIDDGVMWNDLVIEAVANSGGSPRLADESASLERPKASANPSQIVSALLQQLKFRPLDERWEIARRLYSDNVGDEPPRLMMSREMVSDLSTRGFEIGGHTINHPILKELPDEEARKEITGCREWVTTVTGAAPIAFAYPNGRPGVDFDDRHAKMVEEAGFQGSASTEWALAKGSTSPYSVPRIGPWWRQGRGLDSGLLRAYIRSYL